MTATIDVYTDGSCLGNPGPGGWAAIVMRAEGTERLSGGERSTTNNRMEITAVIEGLRATPPGSSVAVHSDSEYLVKTMTVGWKRKANTDLWARLDQLTADRTVDFHWVRAHVGHPHNEQADRLARQATTAVAGRTRPIPAGARSTPARPEPTAGRTDRSPTLTHLDAEGNARMVDVGDKPDSARSAAAAGTVTMQPATLARILQGDIEKGDVFTTARIAGISAAQHTWELIPLAHQIPLSHISVDFECDPAGGAVAVTARARTTAKTGVEMEALAAVSVAALTIYDMCKAADRGMVIGRIRLLEKTGGTHGDYRTR